MHENSASQFSDTQPFASTNAFRDFVFTDPAAWQVTSSNGVASLELTKLSDYQPAVRLPVNIGLIAGRVFDDFILEADLLQTSQEYGRRDMRLFYGFQSPARYYYTPRSGAGGRRNFRKSTQAGRSRQEVSRHFSPGCLRLCGDHSAGFS